MQQIEHSNFNLNNYKTTFLLFSETKHPQKSWVDSMNRSSRLIRSNESTHPIFPVNSTKKRSEKSTLINLTKQEVTNKNSIWWEQPSSWAQAERSQMYLNYAECENFGRSQSAHGFPYADCFIYYIGSITRKALSPGHVCRLVCLRIMRVLYRIAFWCNCRFPFLYHRQF